MRAALAISLRSLRAARPAPAPASRFVVPALAARRLHVSAPRRANEAPPPATDEQMQELRDKIQNHAGCREAILKLGELMQKKGVDLSQPPSTMTMMKLGMDSEIREAGANLMAQLKEAGVDMSPQIASQIFSKVVKD